MMILRHVTVILLYLLRSDIGIEMKFMLSASNNSIIYYHRPSAGFNLKPIVLLQNRQNT